VPHSHNQFIEQAQRDSFGTQAPLTQRRLTQQQQQQTGQEGSGDVICLASDDEEEPAAIVAHPIFEVFWQVRCCLRLSCRHDAVQLDGCMIAGAGTDLSTTARGN
jgi:hypothetical protein